jgi:hypothetical protein
MPTKAPPQRQVQQRDWLAWAEVRGTGWNTNLTAGDIRGGQVNALAGLTHKLTPDMLIGVVAGYENFDYTSQALTGRLKGNGWTAGAYFGWRLTSAIRFDAAATHSEIGYDAIAGTAAGSFPGSRWLVSSGLTGTYRVQGFELEPSARVYALWEHEDTYIDTLGTTQGARNFSTGRASAGGKASYPLPWSDTLVVAPYAGAYADYYFNRDDAATILLPAEFIQGLSARVTSGLAISSRAGAKFTVGAELGGIGSGQFTTWNVRGRASLPF